jgi:hypothetical protein
MFRQEPIVKRHVVDNRVFLLGLDNIYREAMKTHERGELLECAQEVADTLNVPPADVPIEGYYAEDESLTSYFRLARALQGVEVARRPEVEALPRFQRLEDVTSSRLYGVVQADASRLLPKMMDALAAALLRTRPNWSIDGLVQAASQAARKLDDFSLVGLAALAEVPVVLAALRESAVLYSVAMPLGLPPPTIHEYVWQVDDILAAQAGRFIVTFAELFGDKLPETEPGNAEIYWNAADASTILGRCARIGFDEVAQKHYHWAICRASDGREIVQEFWADEIWTTDRYTTQMQLKGGCLEF